MVYNVLIIVYTCLYELGSYMAQVQLIVEIEEDLKQTLKDMAEGEERTLKVFVTRLLKQGITRTKSELKT